MSAPIIKNSVSWSVIKAESIARNIPLQWLDFGDNYFIALIDGPFIITTFLNQNPSDTTDLNDFINNFQAAGNTKVDLNTYTATSRLKVDAEIPSEGTPGVAVKTKKFRILFDDTGITVPTAYATLYSYTGSGKFFGGTFDFNSSNVIVKLEIDSELIFELDLNDVDDMQSFMADEDSLGFQNTCFVSLTSGNRFNIDFCKCPIKYETDIVVSAKKASGSDKTQTRQLVYLSKET